MIRVLTLCCAVMLPLQASPALAMGCVRDASFQTVAYDTQVADGWTIWGWASARG